MKIKNSYVFCALSLTFVIGCEEANQALFSCETVECVEMAVEHGADVNAKNVLNGRTPLIHAIILDRLDVVNALIEVGASTEIPEYVSMMTPLMFAAQYGHFDIVQTLITNGVDVNATRRDGKTALSLSEQKYPDIARVLRVNGAI